MTNKDLTIAFVCTLYWKLAYSQLQDPLKFDSTQFYFISMHKNFSSEKKLPCKKNKKDEISSQFAVKAFETQKPNLPNDFQKIAAKKGLVPRVAKKSHRERKYSTNSKNTSLFRPRCLKSIILPFFNLFCWGYDF